MKHRNCLTYAIALWRYGRQDQLVIRKSHWGWFPHFSVLFELRDGTLVRKEYRPVNPSRRWLPPLFFHGEIITTVYRRIHETKELPCTN